MNKVVDMSDILSEIQSIPKSECERLLRHFDIVGSSDRNLVKHYAIQAKGPNEADFIISQAKSMQDAAWYTVMHELNKAFMSVTDTKHCLFQLLTCNAKIGKILVKAPVGFIHTGVELNELKMFMFSHMLGDEIVLTSEINFTIQVY